MVIYIFFSNKIFFISAEDPEFESTTAATIETVDSTEPVTTIPTDEVDEVSTISPEEEPLSEKPEGQISEEETTSSPITTVEEDEVYTTVVEISDIPQSQQPTISPVAPEIEVDQVGITQSPELVEEDREEPATTSVYEQDASICKVNGTEYSDGDAVPSMDDCQHSCRCVNGTVRCERESCPPSPPQFLRCSVVPIYEEGQCCPIYSCRK